MGCAARVVAETGCTVWAHPASEHFLGVYREPRHHLAERRRRTHRFGVPRARSPTTAPTCREETDGIDGPVRADRFLLAGTRVPTPIGHWQVLEAPGHAPSQVILRQRERRIVIAGDLIGPVFAPFFDVGDTGSRGRAPGLAEGPPGFGPSSPCPATAAR